MSSKETHGTRNAVLGVIAATGVAVAATTYVKKHRNSSMTKPNAFGDDAADKAEQVTGNAKRIADDYS